MTREEAIMILKAYLQRLTDSASNQLDGDIEAFNMAVEVMEREPCEDAVSRQEVLYLIGDYDLSMGQVVKGIHALPSVTPQSKMGHWIIIDDCELFMAKCSECGEIVDSRMISKYPYCHCGAKMQEVKNDT